MKANVWATHNLLVVYKYKTAKCLKHVQHFVTISYYFTYICGLDDKLGAKTVFKNVLMIDYMLILSFHGRKSNDKTSYVLPLKIY